jgi:DNA-binding protein WhiA
MQSFAANVKEELSRESSVARHCRIAELAVLLGLSGVVFYDSGNRIALRIVTENLPVARKVFTLLVKTFKILPEVSVRRRRKGQTLSYVIILLNEEDVLRILKATKLLDKDIDELYKETLVNPLVIKSMCCRRSFLRGAFLAAGSMSDPGKAYHCEWVCTSYEGANQIKGVIGSFNLEAKVTQRKNTWIVYLKEGASVVDVLNVMEAHIALMELENVRILKEMRNTVNRKVNCEAANINKTVLAAAKQVEDIRYLQEVIGLSKLPNNLEEMAVARLTYPDASLKELGEYLSPTVGKSGVNHRLRRICELAEKERNRRGKVRC